MRSDGLDAGPERVYVWVWLPEAVDPVVSGVLQATDSRVGNERAYAFRYAASYRERAEAVSLFTPELPLTDLVFDPTRVPQRDPLPLAGSLRDGAPDAWGRRVINLEVADDPDTELTEATYLLRSGSDRIGALDFQASAREYVARGDAAPLEVLMEAAALVEAGTRLPPALAAAAHGTSIGGARPKALLTHGRRHLIAKFSSSADARPVVKAEAVAMLLAARVGLDVAPVEVIRASGKDVLLVERFDRREQLGADGTARVLRRQMVSLLTVLGRSETNARYASYAELARAVRTGSWQNVPGTLRELFTRLVVNVIVGNTDDHLRNHAAFWDGAVLTLTPAYDVAPQPRSTNPAGHAIAITADGRRASQLRLCRQVAGEFLLAPAQADDIIDHARTVVHEAWDDVCEQASLTRDERAVLWRREFENPYISFDEA